MIRTTINREWIDADIWDHQKKSAARIVVFPDGIPRHITLKNCHWSAYDWLISENACFSNGEQAHAGWDPDLISAHAYQITVEARDDTKTFEDDLRESFEYYLYITINRYIKRDLKIDNDNTQTT